MPQATPLVAVTAADAPPVRLPAGVVRPVRVHIALEYVGFDSAADHREYRLLVREGTEQHRYVVAIPQAAFRDGRAQVQDGPGISYLRMQQEMLAHGLDGPRDLVVSDEELAAYRVAHSPITRGRSRPPVPPSGDQRRPWPMPVRR